MKYISVSALLLILTSNLAFAAGGKIDAVLRQAARKSVELNVMCMSNVIDARNQIGAKRLAIWHHATDGHAAEVNTVIATLTADQACPVSFTAGAMVGQRDF